MYHVLLTLHVTGVCLVPNLNYDSMDHEERQMVYEITGVKNSGVKIN